MVKIPKLTTPNFPTHPKLTLPNLPNYFDSNLYQTLDTYSIFFIMVKGLGSFGQASEALMVATKSTWNGALLQWKSLSMIDTNGGLALLL